MAGRPRHRPRRPHRDPDAVGQLRAVRGDPRDAGQPAPPTCRSTPTTPTSAPSWCSPRPAWSRSSPRQGLVRASGFVARVARGRPAGPRRRLDHLHLRVDRHPQGRRGHATAAPRRSSTPKHECSCRTTRSARATGCSPGCRWRSTPPARRCGWPGGTARAWCLRRGRWCAAAWTWARGWCRATSPSCRRCRRWRRCGPPRRWRRCGC